MTPATFQRLLLHWFDQHGRTHLPWQQNKTPYRVWISEIMLQQTQVNTVIPYFERFMNEFPDIPTLAGASQDRVLHQWAGLGYYSRARNLHRAAKMVVTELNGHFPNSLLELKKLPGIGQSTAGAILAIAFNQATPILDGNVKRVLSRLHAIMEPINTKPAEEKLWQLATAYTPQQRVADYTQAMMDLGATLCTRAKPRCTECPFIKKCLAYQQNIVHLLPQKIAARAKPTRAATFLILQKGQHILLQKRPAQGIWGGLWCLPQLEGTPQKTAIHTFCQKQLQIKVTTYQALEPLPHTFTHYHLKLFPILIPVKKIPAKVMDPATQIWYNPHDSITVGLPKPIQTIIQKLKI